jgi:transposase
METIRQSPSSPLGAGKTRTGRLWVYVRDERSYGGERSPAAAFFYSPDRAGERPRTHLKDFTGVLHAEGYAGLKGLYRGNRIVEAACWASYAGIWVTTFD